MFHDFKTAVQKQFARMATHEPLAQRKDEELMSKPLDELEKMVESL